MNHRGDALRQAPQTAAGVQSDTVWLALFSLGRMSYVFVFVSYSAALPLLKTDWAMSASEAGLIQSAWHLGYLFSLFTVGFLTDRYGARRTYLTGGILASLSALVFAFFADGFLSGLILYGLTGLCSGGSYTPGLTLISERYATSRRGSAMGWFLAASSLGFGVSLVLCGLLMPLVGWRGALIVTSCGPPAAFALSFWTLAATPNLVHPRREGHTGLSALLAVWRNKPAMHIIWAYTFHCWELLGMWAWLPAYLAISIAREGGMTMQAAGIGALCTALTFVTSMGGSIFGGALSDRLGRTRVILWAACLSLVCSFAFGWLLSAPLWILVVVAAFYNLTAIADSSIYSTGLTELVEPRYLGAAYALRSVLGFGAGAVSPWVFGLVIDWARGGPLRSETMAWGLAWTALAVGALLGPLMTLRLRALPAARGMAGGKR